MKRHLQIIIILLTLGSFIFSNFVVLAYSYRYIKSITSTKEKEGLEYRKNSISENIKNIIENESRRNGDISGNNILVSNVFYFDKARELIGSDNKNSDKGKDVIKLAKKYNLKDDLYYRFGKMSVYYKNSNNNLSIGVIDLERYLKKLNNNSYSINVFDNEYNIIGSSENSKGNLPTIDKYTKRMLNGYNETVESSGKMISYSSIEFNGENLYIMLTSKQDIGAGNKRYAKQGMIIIMILTVMSFIIIWKLIRKVNEYIDYEKVSNNFEEYEVKRFIDDLVKNEESIGKYLDSVVELQNLHHDIRRMRERFGK